MLNFVNAYLTISNLLRAIMLSYIKRVPNIKPSLHSWDKFPLDLQCPVSPVSRILCALGHVQD
jgi:hypothetical protein